MCDKSLTCGHQGIADVKDHNGTQSHQKLAKSLLLLHTHTYLCVYGTIATDEHMLCFCVHYVCACVRACVCACVCMCMHVHMHAEYLHTISSVTT